MNQIQFSLLPPVTNTNQTQSHRTARPQRSSDEDFVYRSDGINCRNLFNAADI